MIKFVGRGSLNRAAPPYFTVFNKSLDVKSTFGKGVLFATRFCWLKRNSALIEYSGAAEPPVRTMESHPSGLAEPVFRRAVPFVPERNI